MNHDENVIYAEPGEELLGVVQIARLCRLSAPAVRSWTYVGLADPKGLRHYLGATDQLGRLRISAEQVARFFGRIGRDVPEGIQAAIADQEVST